MYKKIEEQLGRTLNPMEMMKLDELVEKYSINEIVECIKKYPNKNLNYYIAVLNSQQITTTSNNKIPEWLNKPIINEPIDEESQKEHDDFLNFIKEFRES